MTLRIMRSSQTGADRGIPFDPRRMLASVGLLSTAKGKGPMFAELHGGQPQLTKNRIVVADSIKELNKMLSVIHRLELALSATDLCRASTVCRGIAGSTPGRKVMELFDPRRNDERFRKLLDRLRYAFDIDISFTREIKSLLAEAEACILIEIASKERYLQLADIEDENIKAQKTVLAGMELSVLYRLFKAS